MAMIAMVVLAIEAIDLGGSDDGDYFSEDGGHYCGITAVSQLQVHWYSHLAMPMMLLIDEQVCWFLGDFHCYYYSLHLSIFLPIQLLTVKKPLNLN